mmetsp:Transcript_48678/g.112677  ORF Transcript_48678/g.112677 Transcript_48678/m.112677 type:complete len:212 (-) Transcript_48678:154-789(-)
MRAVVPSWAASRAALRLSCALRFAFSFAPTRPLGMPPLSVPVTMQFTFAATHSSAFRASSSSTSPPRAFLFFRFFFCEPVAAASTPASASRCPPAAGGSTLSSALSPRLPRLLARGRTSSGSVSAPSRSPLPCPSQPILSSIAWPKPEAIGVSAICVAACCCFLRSFFPPCRDGGSSATVAAAGGSCAAHTTALDLDGFARGLLSPGGNGT